MKWSVYGLLDSGLLRRSAGVILSLFLVGSGLAVVLGSALISGKQVKQERMLGERAVMHVYSYAPKTFEITSVTSHFFKDVDACESAVSGTLRTAMSHVKEGDRVEAHCVAVVPPEALAQPDDPHLPDAVTKL